MVEPEHRAGLGRLVPLVAPRRELRRPSGSVHPRRLRHAPPRRGDLLPPRRERRLRLRRARGVFLALLRARRRRGPRVGSGDARHDPGRRGRYPPRRQCAHHGRGDREGPGTRGRTGASPRHPRPAPRRAPVGAQTGCHPDQRRHQARRRHLPQPSRPVRWRTLPPVDVDDLGRYGQNRRTSRPRFPPASRSRCASAASSIGIVRATRSVNTPSSACARSSLSFSCSSA